MYPLKAPWQHVLFAFSTTSALAIHYLLAAKTSVFRESALKEVTSWKRLESFRLHDITCWLLTCNNDKHSCVHHVSAIAIQRCAAWKSTRQSVDILHCYNPIINTQSVHTFAISSRCSKIQTRRVRVAYITIKWAWMALPSKVRLQLPSRDEKQMKHFEAELIPLPSCNSICHSQRLILSKSAFHHDLHHTAQDERGGYGLCPQSSPCQGSRGTEASRTPANWE